MLQSLHPQVDVGLLWVEMFRFYSLEFNMADNVIGVRTNAVLSREMKDWPKKRIAVEGQRLSHLLMLKLILLMTVSFFFIIILFSSVLALC